MGTDNYCVSVSENQMELLFGMVCPPVLVSQSQLMKANGDRRRFNWNTHKATAFKKAVLGVHEAFGWEDMLLGAAQRIRLPFKVELEVVNDEEFSEACGSIQYYLVFSVDLVSAEKLKQKKTRGSFRLINSRQNLRNWRNSQHDQNENRNSNVQNKNGQNKTGNLADDDNDDDDDGSYDRMDMSTVANYPDTF
mmetsp:Transcript_49488/g.59907  ORF Transcript_49488/g.59907 Transcript_49488/m.59907 type:complete len:193 (+) Transcript_49488:129-707(+)